MKHLGDITKINGANVPPVNVVIGGSPCQDLSVAGRREGLKGERSGLFMEQIRIIKEMREKSEQSGTTDIKPRYMVWENVPGAFSSNKGQDFKAVLEETIGVVEKVKPDIPIPVGGWHYSGAIMGNGFSVAWRVFDAQFWRTPQRRRRIALVADFGGATAPEILFERESVSRNTLSSETPWEIFAAVANERFGATDSNGPGSKHLTYCIGGNIIERSSTQNGKGLTEDLSFTLTTADRHAVYDARGNGDGKTVPTITGDHENRRLEIKDEKSGTIRANNDQFVIAIDRAAFNQGENAQYDPRIFDDGINSTLAAKGPSAVCQNTVRRLTPLECERLQGFPDGWTDIGDYIDTKGKKRKTSDSARYKALGNSIALPSWVWVLERLARCCGSDYTMASLFDGIGGFPLIWETLNGEGTCLWASEIENFPIAVTKYHFNNHH
nr:DNA cytosine methyltransferase [uncultured Ruminococcus sp.]